MIDGQDLRLLRLNGLGSYADEILFLREQLRLCNIDQCNAEARLAEADERHGRYVKAVGELAGMAARIQDAQRYRWLVSQNDPIIWNYLGGMDDDQIDEAIDKWIADDAHLSRPQL